MDSRHGPHSPGPASKRARQEDQRSPRTPNDGGDQPVIIFKFKSKPPTAIAFAHFLKTAAPLAAVQQVSHLRDGTGFIVRASSTTINRLKGLNATAFPDFQQFESHCPRARQAHTSHAKSAPSSSFVVTRVDKEITEQEVTVELQTSGLSVTKSLRIISRATNQPTTLVRVFVEREENANRAVTLGVAIGWMHHRCEASNSKPTPVQVTQCYKCQGLGHTSKDCEAATKCLRCGDAHKVKDCTANKTDAKCSNCGGAHPALFKGCPKYKEAVKEATAAKEYRRKATYAVKAGGSSGISPIQIVGFVTEFIQQIKKTIATCSYREMIETAANTASYHFNCTFEEHIISNAVKRRPLNAEPSSPDHSQSSIGMVTGFYNS